jgi:hypothetical protein
VSLRPAGAGVFIDESAGHTWSICHRNRPVNSLVLGAVSLRAKHLLPDRTRSYLRRVGRRNFVRLGSQPVV